MGKNLKLPKRLEKIGHGELQQKVRTFWSEKGGGLLSVGNQDGCVPLKSWKLGTKMFEAKTYFPRKVWRPRSVGYVLFLPVSQRFQHRNGWFGRGSSKDPNIFFHQNIE